MLKGVKIKETFLDFLEAHPEISAQMDPKKNDLKISFPDDAEKVSYTYCLGEISIFYIYNGEEISFSGRL